MKQKIDKLYETINRNKLSLLIIFFVALCFMRVTESVRVHDDIEYYYLRGGMLLGNKTFWDIIKEGILSFWYRGRFFPLSAHAYLVYYLCNNNDVVYKSLIIIFSCVNVFQLGMFIGKLLKSERAKYLSMIAMALFFQIYPTYHNGLFGYHLFMQIMTALLLISLSCLFNFLQMEENRCDLYIMSVCCIIGMLSYEVGYVYTAVFIIAIMLKKDKFLNKLKDSLWLVVPMVILVSINVYAKLMYGTGYAGIDIKLDLSTILLTFCKQIYAGLPMSHLIAQHDGVFLPHSFVEWIKQIDFHILLTVIMAVFLIVESIRSTEELPYMKIKKTYNSNIIILTVILCLGGVAGLISLTAKYQTELYFGVGHISSYIEYFLFCIIFLCIYCLLLNRIRIIRSFTKYCLPVIFIFLLTFNLISTKVYVNVCNNGHGREYELIREALQQGILDYVPEDSLIFIHDYHQWDNSDFYAEFSGRRVSTYPYSEIHNMDEAELAMNNVYVLDYEGDVQDGQVLVSRVNSFGTYAGEYREPLTSETLYFTLLSKWDELVAEDMEGNLVMMKPEQMQGVMNNYVYCILVCNWETTCVKIDSMR